MFSLSSLLQVALGGAIGSTLRYGVSIAAGRAFGTGFPWGTLIVNVVGSFAMGALFALLVQKGDLRLTSFLMTGLLGGFTTFSAFSLDAMSLWERGHAGLALVYVAASVILSLAAIALSLHLFRGAFA